MHYRQVHGYNSYTCETHEIYCSSCKLFVGHAFEDGKASAPDGVCYWEQRLLLHAHPRDTHSR